MHSCSNQYNCQSNFEQILTSVCRYFFNAKTRRRVLKFLNNYNFASFWTKYERFVICFLIIAFLRKILPLLFTFIYNFLQPNVDVEEDNEPFEEIEPDSNDDDNSENCSICLENFKNKKIALLENCCHFYHPKCIEKWYENGYGDCPICRQVSDLYYIHTRLVRNPILKQMIFNEHKDKLGPRIVEPKKDELNEEERQQLVQRIFEHLTERLRAEDEQNNDSDFTDLTD